MADPVWLPEVLRDPQFWASVKVTAIFAILATVIETVLGVCIALLLNRSSLIGKVFERVLILPDGVEDIWGRDYVDLIELA